MENLFLTFTALAIGFVIAFYILHARKVERERNYWMREYKHDLTLALLKIKKYKGVIQTLELERDELKRDLENHQLHGATRCIGLLKKLSDNRAYTRTPSRSWRRQDKLTELKFRNEDGSYFQF